MLTSLGMEIAPQSDQTMPFVLGYPETISLMFLGDLFEKTGIREFHTLAQ
jgi:hypothetical protein